MANIAFQENVPLADYTTFKVGGPARFFLEVKTIEEIRNAVAWAIEKGLPIFVLADGSNVIVSQKGFSGLVIKTSINGIKVADNRLIAGAATSMKIVVDCAVSAGMSGIEWAGGLPGSFGGAIRGNAGAFGGEIKDSAEEVVSISLTDGELRKRDNQACEFGYRESIFKKLGSEVIISAILRLKPGEKNQLRAIADDHIMFRQNRHPLDYPNSGSIFKNTPVEKVSEQWQEHFKDFIKTDPFPIVPTGKIIEDSGLKGRQVGGAQVSSKHANYIVNTGGATGEDIFELINQIKQTVREKFGIELEVEPELLGF